MKKITIVEFFSVATLYEITAHSIKSALEEAIRQRAYLRGADLRGADLRQANLQGADLESANFKGANLRNANLRNANLRNANLRNANLQDANLQDADLRGAYLREADLQGAYLWGAILRGANLWGAAGVNPSFHAPLLLLLEQPGKIRAYKLITDNYTGPYHRGITYAVGETYEVSDACTDPNIQCGPGINVATLDWCLREYQQGYHILIVEFMAADIAAIPTATDGKFRLHRCTVVGEKDVSEMGEERRTPCDHRNTDQLRPS